jgi:hypothetical protein
MAAPIRRGREAIMNDFTERAERVALALNGFIGLLHAARITATVWIRHSEKFPIAGKYGLQMTGGTILLTLRRFEDLWGSHITKLLPEDSVGRNRGEWVIHEINNRQLRVTVNRLVAHYSGDKLASPLSNDDIRDLIQLNGWATEQDMLRWTGEVMWRVMDVRNDLVRRSDLPTPDDGWLKQAMEIFEEAGGRRN